MKQTILDTSFIVSAVRNKIDIFEDLIGYQIIIPEQVLKELENLKTSDAKLALKILQLSRFTKVDLGKGHVDKLIMRFARKNPKVIVATLDREIKAKVKNHKMVIRGKKKLEVI